MQETKPKKKPSYKFALLFIAILLAGSYLVSGIYGLKVVAILLFFAIPFYLILTLYNFKLYEKLIYSIFISLAFFPFFVYWIMQIIKSYRISLIVTYIALIVVYFILSAIKKRSPKPSSD